MIHTINAFLPLIRAGSTKKVFSVSSAAADPDAMKSFGMAGLGPYCISKAGLNITTVNYAVEYKDEGVIFVAISPGFVNTETAARGKVSIASFFFFCFSCTIC